jgi:hypothetical protein
MKKGKSSSKPGAKLQATAKIAPVAVPIEIALEDLGTLKVQEAPAVKEEAPVAMPPVRVTSSPVVKDALPDVDCVELLFRKNSPVALVQTIQYKAKVPWKSGRSAWLVDYASHYKTPLHFIARSINGRADYEPKMVGDGQSFNVLSESAQFHLLIDLSRCKLWLYGIMPEKGERVLLKTYPVGLGRPNPQRASGSLTPLGKYRLGNRIAIFKPKMMGNHKGKRVELITVFGTRWIPFEKELENCTEPAKGYGIHGTPWRQDPQQGPQTGKLIDSMEGLGKYESDGCIRLKTQDIEEIYAIISTRDATIEIVSDFSKAKLPGKEKIY